MSVVVRMEMPQNCWVCPFGSDRFIWDENDGRPHYVMVRFCSRHSGEEFHVLKTDTIDRPWYCDSFICSLPEGHGRLVDADTFSGHMKEYQERIMKWREQSKMEGPEESYHRADSSLLTVVATKLILDNAPTIVPAAAERSETCLD